MTIAEIDQLIDEGAALKLVAQAYSEVANIKIKKIRAAVERNRLFFDEISQVYGVVKAFALKRKVSQAKPKARLHILITSNEKFYGHISLPLINFFIGTTRELPDADRILLGKGAVDFFRTSKFLPRYSEVILKDDMPTGIELANLVKTISEYNQVLVFYSKLKSLLVQRPTFTDLTATSYYTQSFQVGAHNTRLEAQEIHSIFEPELPKLLYFFDSQILTLLLEQAFLESELSRTASRFISMDQAQIEADKFIKEYEILKAYTKRSIENNRILENYAAIMATKEDGQQNAGHY